MFIMQNMFGSDWIHQFNSQNDHKVLILKDMDITAYGVLWYFTAFG